jgi:hypothetical protein
MILQFAACLNPASQAEGKPPKQSNATARRVRLRRAAWRRPQLREVRKQPRLCEPARVQVDDAEDVEVRLARPSAKIRDRWWLMLRL